MGQNFNNFRKQFDKDEFAKSAGITLIEALPGYAVARMEITGKHLNSVGTLHGGAMFTLADFTFAVASNAHGRLALAIHADISFFKAVRSGTLKAVAREISLHDKLGTYLVEIMDDAGEIIAHFKGTAYRKNELIHFDD